MKIAVLNTAVFVVGKSGASGYSGLEHLAWLTAKGLAEKGHTVSLFAAEGSECPGVEIIPIGPSGLWDESKSYSTYWQRLLEFDVIIDETWQKWSYILKQEGRLKAPVLGVLHAPVNTMYQSLPPVDKPCIVCISQDQANHFEALHSRTARVAHNGCDVNHYQPMNIPRTDRFLFLARFSSIKGPDIAIEACKAAGVGLDLIGDTSITNEPELLAKCKSMCDGKQIRLVGSVGRGETVWWYSQAHCLIHPNQRFREPYGLAPVESMLCGTPVIAWDYGAMRETISHGDSGWLVKSFDELVNMIKSVTSQHLKPDEMDHFNDTVRKSSRAWAKRFSVEAMCDRYEQLCEEALNGGW